MEQTDDCHKTKYINGRISLLSIDQPPVEDVLLILLRTIIEKTNRLQYPSIIKW